MRYLGAVIPQNTDSLRFFGLLGLVANLGRMIHILQLFLAQMGLSLRSRAELHIENLALRHQIEILKRNAPMPSCSTTTPISS